MENNKATLQLGQRVLFCSRVARITGFDHHHPQRFEIVTANGQRVWVAPMQITAIEPQANRVESMGYQLETQWADLQQLSFGSWQGRTSPLLSCPALVHLLNEQFGEPTPNNTRNCHVRLQNTNAPQAAAWLVRKAHEELPEILFDRLEFANGNQRELAMFATELVEEYLLLGTLDDKSRAFLLVSANRTSLGLEVKLQTFQTVDDLLDLKMFVTQYLHAEHQTRLKSVSSVA